MTKLALVNAVRSYARSQGGGWQMIATRYTDLDIQYAFGRARTVKGAVAKLAAHAARFA